MPLHYFLILILLNTPLLFPAPQSIINPSLVSSENLGRIPHMVTENLCFLLFTSPSKLYFPYINTQKALFQSHSKKS